MTSVTAGLAFALPVHRWRDVPAHAVMLVVMAGTMIGGPSALRSLLGIGALVATMMLSARAARDDAVFRAHLVDLGAMALLLIGCLPAHSRHLAQAGHALHEHFALVTGPGVVAVAIAGWMLARFALARRRASGRREAIVSACFVGAGLALMALFCAHTG